MTTRSGAASSGSSLGDALPPLEMWAGVECTINRVRNRYRDQLALAGTYGRPDDASIVWPTSEFVPYAGPCSGSGISRTTRHGG